MKLLPIEQNYRIWKFLHTFQDLRTDVEDERFSAESLIKHMEEEIEKRSQIDIQSNTCLQIIRKFSIPMVQILNDEWPRTNRICYLGRFSTIHSSNYDCSDDPPKMLPHHFSTSFVLLNDNEEVMGSCNITRMNYPNKTEFLNLNNIFLKEKKNNSKVKKNQRQLGYRWNYLDDDDDKYNTKVEHDIEMFLLESVIIKRSERGKGYGKWMLNELEIFLKNYLKVTKCKYICIYLTTQDQMKFYENFHYKFSEKKIIMVKTSTSKKLRNNRYLNSLQEDGMRFDANVGTDLAYFKLLEC